MNILPSLPTAAVAQMPSLALNCQRFEPDVPSTQYKWWSTLPIRTLPSRWRMGDEVCMSCGISSFQLTEPSLSLSPQSFPVPLVSRPHPKTRIPVDGGSCATSVGVVQQDSHLCCPP